MARDPRRDTPRANRPAVAAARATGRFDRGLLADERRERRALFGLCAPSLLLIGVILCVPIGWLFWLSVVGANGGLSMENYRRLWESSAYVGVLRTTFGIGFLVTGICLVLGYPLAYLLAEVPRRTGAVLMVAVILPYWTSVLVRTYAWLVLLQRRGLVNTVLMSTGIIDEPLRLVHNLTGTVIGMVHIMLPFMVLPLYAAMRAIDRDYLKAAASLGASPTVTFWRVFFPLSLPGTLAGTFLVFVLCLGFYVTPAILGGGRVIMIAQHIQGTLELYAHWGAASALGVLLLVLTLAILYLASRLGHLTGLRIVAGGP
jgi:putative spermidine/putrescine transport system permease protein/spermidine/putrescine transport system permease protein